MKSYKVTWSGPITGRSSQTLPASSLGSALNNVRHMADINRGGKLGETVTITVERVS
jgi:hypothetical protein